MPMYERLLTSTEKQLRKLSEKARTELGRSFFAVLAAFSLLLAIEEGLGGTALIAGLNVAAGMIYLFWAGRSASSAPADGTQCLAVAAAVCLSFQIEWAVSVVKRPSWMVAAVCLDNIIVSRLLSNGGARVFAAVASFATLQLAAVPTDCAIPSLLARLLCICCRLPSLERSSFTFSQMSDMLSGIDTTGTVLVSPEGELSFNKVAVDMLGTQNVKEALGGILPDGKGRGRQDAWTQLAAGNGKGQIASRSELEYKVYALAGEERGGAVFVRRVVKLDKETDYSKTKGLHRRMLLMSMSHEFRNPVNGIRRNNWEGLLAMLPLLKERLSDPQDQYQVDAIITCAKFLNNYISNWLDYLSIEGNEFELKRKPFNLETFLENVLSLIMMQANRKGLVIDLQKGGDLPEIVFSDECRLEQIILNLLMNALKYTPKGTITLRVTRDSRESQLLMFQVSDSGVGMSLEKKVQLFKLFGGADDDELKPGEKAQRSIPPRSHPRLVVGFGLTVTNMLCKQIGRELIVDSEADKGTTFSFWVRSEPSDAPFKKFRQISGDKSRSSRNLDKVGSVSHSKLKIKAEEQHKSHFQAPRTTFRVETLDPESNEDAEASDGNTCEFAARQGVGVVARSRPAKFLSFQSVPVSFSGPGHRTARRSDNNAIRGLLGARGATMKSTSGGKGLPVKQHTSSVESEKAHEEEKKRTDKKRRKSRKKKQETEPVAPDTPKLVEANINMSSARMSTPNARSSAEFADILATPDKSRQITALSFLPGKDLLQNKEFLQDQVMKLTKQKSFPGRHAKRVYHQSMLHLNHPCKCPIVLIVDDNEINKIALSGMLQRFGLICLESSNGAEALNVLRRENRKKNCCDGIRLVLMDYDMPVMNGITASREIRRMTQAGEIKGTVVVAVTAYQGVSIEKECLAAGMKEFVPKPVEIDKLFDCIERNLATAH